MAWRRSVMAALALLVALGALAGAYPGDGGHKMPEPLRQTLCFGCHENWSRAPLRAMATLQPAQTVSARNGDSFDFGVQVRNAWLADFPGMNVCMDIGAAPSLQFVGAAKPIEGAKTHVDFPYDASRPAQPQSRSTTVPVPTGASYLRFILRPDDSTAFGPDLTLVVTPPGVVPQRINQNGTGGAEVLALSGSEAQRYPAGNWTLSGEVGPLFDAANATAPKLPPSSASFTLQVDARFEAGQLRRLCQPVADTTPQGKARLVTWHLSMGPVQPGTVNVTADVTAYYDHDSFAPNYGNVTQGIEVPLEVAEDKATLVRPEVVLARPILVNGPTLVAVSEVVGYAAAFLLLASIASGGMLGKASRRALSSFFGSAKRRVAFHNFLSYGIILASFVHMAVFLFRFTRAYEVTLGIIWGGLAILAMFGLGVTGALQIPMIRRWSYNSWRFTHYGMTVAVILFTVVHMLLDGAHFGFVQEALHWTDPFTPGKAGVQ